MPDSTMTMTPTVCVKCLVAIGDAGAAHPISRRGEVWLACNDTEGCSERQSANRKSHQREISRRMRSWRKNSHLVVILDFLGAEFGYGNRYVEVPHGGDPHEVAASYMGDSDELVLEGIYEIRRPDETAKADRADAC